MAAPQFERLGFVHTAAPVAHSVVPQEDLGSCPGDGQGVNQEGATTCTG